MLRPVGMQRAAGLPPGDLMKGKHNASSSKEGRVLGVLTMKPVPMAVQFTVEEVTAHRHFECAQYDECLDLAVRKKWANFTCRECPIWEFHKRNHEDTDATGPSSDPFSE